MEPVTHRPLRGRTFSLATISAVLAGPVLLVGCMEDVPAYEPHISAADFVAEVTNPFLPLRPGNVWTYDGPSERVEIRVLHERKNVNGVSAIVVRDTVSVAGAVQEDTYDWYAQDRLGNVWYLGEDTKEYENGAVVSTEGSWMWGVDGALPGIVMKGDPRPDHEPYFQEFYWPEAVDEAAVVDQGRSINVPQGSYTDTITTKEWTRVEPGLEELKHYARGVGLVLEEKPDGTNPVRLVSFVRG